MKAQKESTSSFAVNESESPDENIQSFGLSKTQASELKEGSKIVI